MSVVLRHGDASDILLFMEHTVIRKTPPDITIGEIMRASSGDLMTIIRIEEESGGRFFIGRDVDDGRRLTRYVETGWPVAVHVPC